MPSGFGVQTQGQAHVHPERRAPGRRWHAGLALCSSGTGTPYSVVDSAGWVFGLFF